MSFDTWMHDVRQRTEVALNHYLPASTHTPTRLHRAMRYACLGGGKRLRPILVHAAGAVSNAAPEILDASACAIEMIHVYSLIHDDMPCMDNDILRRGMPTCHIEFDEATALLAGDSLLTQAFITLTSAPLPVAILLEQVRTLATASGTTGMAGGQAIDLAAVGTPLNEAQLEQMHIMKTGALIRAAIRIGALAGEPLSAEQLNRLDQYGKTLGLLFQVVDDILDCTSTTEVLGKTAGKDAAADKPTYVSLMGLSSARDFAQDLLNQTQKHIADSGKSAERLKDIALEIFQRTH